MFKENIVQCQYLSNIRQLKNMDENENLLNFEIPECDMERFRNNFQTYRDPGDLIAEAGVKSTKAPVFYESSLNSDSDSSLNAEKDPDSSEYIERFYYEALQKERCGSIGYIKNNFNYGLKQKRTSFYGSLSEIEEFELRNAKRICTGINKNKPELSCKEEIQKSEFESQDRMKGRYVESASSPELLAGPSDWNPSLHVDASTGEQPALPDEMKGKKTASKRQRISSPAVIDEDNIDVMKKLKIEDSPAADNVVRKHGD